MPKTQRLIYVHDPMCSWCWGFRPTFEKLCRELPQDLAIQRLLGGLAADSDRPMPLELQKHLQDTWRHIQERIPGTRFNFAFWHECQPRRSTWPACRAVIAARELDPQAELPMIDAIQHAYYLEARNPSDASTLTALASRVGLDQARFAHNLNATRTQEILNQEITAARAIGATGFPSLRLQLADSYWPIPIDYTDVEPMLSTISMLLEDEPT